MKPIKHEVPRMGNNDAVLEKTMLNINSTLLDLRQEMRHGFEKIDQRFEAMDQKIDHKIDNVRNFIWSTFLWLTGMIIGLAGLIAHTQHWI